jgi:hypothetical protein
MFAVHLGFVLDLSFSFSHAFYVRCSGSPAFQLVLAVSGSGAEGELKISLDLSAWWPG